VASRSLVVALWKTQAATQGVVLPRRSCNGERCTVRALRHPLLSTQLKKLFLQASCMSQLWQITWNGNRHQITTTEEAPENCIDEMVKSPHFSRSYECSVWAGYPKIRATVSLHQMCSTFSTAVLLSSLFPSGRLHQYNMNKHQMSQL
jgi:hypothetical protein